MAVTVLSVGVFRWEKSKVLTSRGPENCLFWSLYMIRHHRYITCTSALNDHPLADLQLRFDR